jgi:hypothetical protein
MAIWMSRARMSCAMSWADEVEMRYANFMLALYQAGTRRY